MPFCPNCHQSIDSQAVKCPHCRTELKAYGHPGMPLYQAGQEGFLCDNCVYHVDDSCDFPQRPYAKTCTLYQSPERPRVESSVRPLYPTDPLKKIKVWCFRHRGILLIIGLIIVSLIIAL